MSNKVPIRVLIADTSYIVRQGLRALVQEQTDMEYMTSVPSYESLLTVLEHQTPNVLIADHCCDTCFSLERITHLRNQFSDMQILLISQEKDAELIQKALNTGIKNYLLKDCDEEELCDAIRACSKGETYLCQQIVDVLLDKTQPTAGTCETGNITERELEIIRLLVQGRRPKEIADILFISHYTVSTHKKNIYKKLGVNHSYELAQFAYKMGLIAMEN